MAGDVIQVSEAFQSYLSRGDETGSPATFWELLERCGVDPAGPPVRSLVVERTLSAAGREPLPVFVKAYGYPGLWQGFLRRGRVEAEVRNLALFAARGIPVPKVVAWGVRRGFGGLVVRRECLVTAALAGALMLDDFVREVCPDPRDAAQGRIRRGLAQQIADGARAIHQRRFFHRDLKWRNLLVVAEAGAPGGNRVYWIDCPSGYTARWERLARNGWKKDLATLDKVASEVCTLAERVRFLRRYLGARPGESVRGEGGAVVAYRRRREEGWREIRISPAAFEKMLAKGEVLERDSHGPKVVLRPEGTILKVFRVKRRLSSNLWCPYARRFARNAAEVARRGFASVTVERVFTIPAAGRQAVLYRRLEGDTLRAVVGREGHADRLAGLAELLARLHGSGVYFRSVHFGNILVTPPGRLALIDVMDMRFRRGGLGPARRARNFVHLCRYAEDRAALGAFGWERFLEIYARASGWEAGKAAQFRRDLERRGVIPGGRG